jgi:DNA-binding CsgD family transcriptional regulator
VLLTCADRETADRLRGYRRGDADDAARIGLAARSGNAELAADAMERLAEHATASGTNLAHGIRARASALVSHGEAAEQHYREAVERLSRSRMALDLARAHLLYGEWLRREQRRVDARKQLRAAYEMFGSMGAAAFAERARRELLATGETVGARTPEAAGRLTAQEAQIAQMASDGLSNPEIGARLFISPRTVQYHLRKVFAKLDVSSRNQLQKALGPEVGVDGAGPRGWPVGLASGR